MPDPLVLLDRYEVIRRLAIGGMGEIFLVRQRMGSDQSKRGITRLAIVKTLRPELSEQAEALDQFLDEARVAAQLSHPNVVQVYEVGFVNDVHFIAMEYIGGIDFGALQKACVREQRPISPRVAAALVRDAALGLDYAHNAVDDVGRSLKLVHRDVSPQNIMVRADGLVKVVDFGIALASNQVHETQADKIKGKIRYMSPEQLLGEDLDARSDLFSLGIVLWELLCGRPLFAAATSPIDLFQRIAAAEFPKPSSVRPDVTPELDAVVAGMLRPKRDERTQHCADVAHALSTFLLAGGPVEGEVRALVQAVAGEHIADRVRDLTPRAVSLHGIGATAPATAVGSADAPHSSEAEPTRIEDAALSSMATRPSRPPGPAFLLEEQPEPSDGAALLDASEMSGVMRGDRRFVTIAVGLLPGWAVLATRLSNVPMGAFATSRLKNMFLRELQAIVKREGGVVVRYAPEAFVLAFGVEDGSTADAARAVRCATAIQKVVVDLARDPNHGTAAHIGIASGMALASTDQGPVQIGGLVVERAERLAELARSAGRPMYLSGQVAELVRGQVALKPAVPPDDPLVGDGVHDASDPSERAATAQRKILIADDAEVFRRIEEEILRPFNFEFIHARDGAQALKLALEHKPDLILLDVQMPVMDGIQVLSFLRKNDATKDIPVCVVSTISRAHDEELLRRGGANAVLTKPVKPAMLIQTVRTLLNPRGDPPT